MTLPTVLLLRPEVFFREGATEDVQVPRGLVVDLDAASLDSARAALQSSAGKGKLSPQFSPDQFVGGGSSAGGAHNNWATGHYTDGAEIVDVVMDAFRHEVERCDSPHAVQLAHSLGGGCGSGTGALLLQKVAEEYPDILPVSFSVFPSDKVSDVVVEPYNATLGLASLIEDSSMTFVLDNESLFRVSDRRTSGKANLGDMNRVVGMAMSDATCALRFPGPINASYRKMAVNLIPFPRLHFLSVGLAPIYSPQNQAYAVNTAETMMRDVFDGRNTLANYSRPSGWTDDHDHTLHRSDGEPWLTAHAVYRGKRFGTEEVEQAASSFKTSSRFVEWIPDSISVSVCDVPRLGVANAESCTSIGNQLGFKEVVRRLGDKFTPMFRRKAFLHWYLDEGMDEMEFTEAESNMYDLLSEMQQGSGCCCGRWAEEEEDWESEFSEEDEL